MAMGSFASGGVLSHWGWDTVLVISFAPVIVACIAMLMMSNKTASE
jgi:predicted MFS family arabinose efflux permease